jgi:hypothetical protein
MKQDFTGLIWGELVTIRNGAISKVLLNEAIQYCLDLNGDGLERQQIAETLLSDGQPLHGYYLPTVENYKNVLISLNTTPHEYGDLTDLYKSLRRSPILLNPNDDWAWVYSTGREHIYFTNRGSFSSVSAGSGLTSAFRCVYRPIKEELENLAPHFQY